MRPEWRRRLDFADVAEALGVPTDHVMAAMPVAESGSVTVLYSEHVRDDTASVHIAVLRPDRDGILRRVRDEPTGWTVADYLPPI